MNYIKNDLDYKVKNDVSISHYHAESLIIETNTENASNDIVPYCFKPPNTDSQFE